MVLPVYQFLRKGLQAIIIVMVRVVLRFWRHFDAHACFGTIEGRRELLVPVDPVRFEELSNLLLLNQFSIDYLPRHLPMSWEL